MKIHYRNRHGKTNVPWQKAFRDIGLLSMGPWFDDDSFPDEIDHLHLGGSCKGTIPITKVMDIQADTGCSVSSFFGDPVPDRFKFHHQLLDYVPRAKVYSAALYGTEMWRDDVEWVLHPTDEEVFELVEHELNDVVLFSGALTPFRRHVIGLLKEASIQVDVVGHGGNLVPKYGRGLVEVSKKYHISIGIPYDEVRPKKRYSSTRLPNALAMGLIYIESDFDLKDVFDSDEIIQWSSVEDLIDKIHYYQKHPLKGMKTILKGRKKVLENWTFSKLAKRFLREGGFEV